MRSGNSILMLAHIFNGNFQEVLLERPLPTLILHNQSSQLERIFKVIQSPHNQSYHLPHILQLFSFCDPFPVCPVPRRKLLVLTRKVLTCHFAKQKSTVWEHHMHYPSVIKQSKRRGRKVMIRGLGQRKAGPEWSWSDHAQVCNAAVPSQLLRPCLKAKFSNDIPLHLSSSREKEAIFIMLKYLFPKGVWFYTGETFSHLPKYYKDERFGKYFLVWSVGAFR